MILNLIATLVEYCPGDEMGCRDNEADIGLVLLLVLLGVPVFIVMGVMGDLQQRSADRQARNDPHVHLDVSKYWPHEREALGLNHHKVACGRVYVKGNSHRYAKTRSASDEVTCPECRTIIRRIEEA